MSLYFVCLLVFRSCFFSSCKKKITWKRQRGCQIQEIWEMFFGQDLNTYLHLSVPLSLHLTNLRESNLKHSEGQDFKSCRLN